MALQSSSTSTLSMMRKRLISSSSFFSSNNRILTIKVSYPTSNFKLPSVPHSLNNIGIYRTQNFPCFHSSGDSNSDAGNFANRSAKSTNYHPEIPIIRLVPRGPSDETKFGSLVYIGRQNRQIMAMKYIVITSCVSGFLAQPFLLNGLSSLPLMMTLVMGMVGTFYIYTAPFLMHLMTRRYVMRLYYDHSSGNFTVVALRFFPLRRFITFSPSDVNIPQVTSALVVISIRQKNGQRDIRLFINPSDFMDQTVYGKLMGYNKPVVLNEEQAI